MIQVPWSRAAWLGGLMFASALTEAFGLVLLVPMLAALGGDPAGAGGIAHRIAALGIPLAPGPLLATFVVLVLLRALVNHARLLAAHGLEVTLVDRLRARAWEALLNCDWRTLSAMRQSDNASTLITNIDRIGYGVNQLLAASAMAVTLGGLGIAALAISPPVALAALVGAALVLTAYRGMRRRAQRLGEQLGEAYRHVHADIDEGLGALRIVKSFAAEDRMAQRSKAAFAGLRRTQRAYLRDQSLAQIALQIGGALVLALTVWLAIARWGAGTEQILPLVALFVRALPLLGNLQQAWQNWSHARAAIGEAAALISAAEAGAEQVGHTASAVSPPRLDRAIRLEGVSVALRAGQPALDGISLELPARTTLAITGASGAGKSTLADLLGGLISPDAGLMLVDDVALDQANRRGWRAAVAYVQQEPVLFTGSVRENLLWARPGASEEELNAALERAAAGFVLALPGGLEHPLGEGARHLSGGERQRIALARALLREPQLLILDEATSALDPAAEADVASALAALAGELTMVIIGHRGKLREIADRVIKLDAGRIVG